MLYHLTQLLVPTFSAFNVFQYLTLRAILSVLTALIICLAIGPAMIRRLTFYKIGQTVRTDGPQTHLTKSGTPTMGGVLILVSVGIATLLWADLTNRYVWIVLLTTLAFGVIGWMDDYRKLIKKDPKGLIARWKYFWQSVCGLAAAIALYAAAQEPAAKNISSARSVPSDLF